MDEVDSTIVRNKCLHCGSIVTIKTGRGAHIRRYCNSVCRSRANAERRRTKKPTCKVDGCLNISRSLSAGICEAHYYRLRRTGSIETQNNMSSYDNCLHCGNITGNGFNKFCSSRCNARHRNNLPLVSNCKVCGNEYKPAGKAVCCSVECKDELNRIQARARYADHMANSAEFRVKVRNHEYKRKALKKKAFVETVDINVVHARDGGLCWLCKTPVLLNTKWPLPEFASLDHVIPLAKGGEHSYANIKLSHLRCNMKKGAKLLTVL